MADRCERTELLVDECAHCKGHKPLEEQATTEYADFLATRPRWLPARYPGACEPCGQPFEVGTPITGAGWRQTGWRAYCCREAS